MDEIFNENKILSKLFIKIIFRQNILENKMLTTFSMTSNFDRIVYKTSIFSMKIKF